MKATAVIERTREAYDAIFETARRLEYPEVDAFEQRMGYAINRQRLEEAARVLACPLKGNPPHWQHGRVIFAATCSYLERTFGSDGFTDFKMLDIGTAKGFSALCLWWAADDLNSEYEPEVWSVDVIDPYSRVSRNTVAELDGPLTIDETLAPWGDEHRITFVKATGVEWLTASSWRINVAFIDGKHEGHVVRQEGKLLAARQQPGDLAIFDDCQIPGVSQAVVSLQEFYKFEYVKAEPREYAVGWRR